MKHQKEKDRNNERRTRGIGTHERMPDTKRGPSSRQPKYKKSQVPDGATNEMLTHLDKSAT